MKRHIISSIALFGLSACPVLAQDGVWKPVEHRARYESAPGQISLIGRPITGRSKVDQSVERAGFAPDLKPAAPLPPAPAGKPIEAEVLPFPKSSSSYSQGSLPNGYMVQPGNGMPVGSYPVINYPATSSGLVPQPAGTPVLNGQIVNGQVVNGPIYSSPVYGGQVIGGNPYSGEGFPGMQTDAFSDRYYKQAIHGSPGIWYGSVDYMALNLTADTSPPLLVTGTQAASATPPFFTVSNLRTLYGNDLPADTMYGGRVMMGLWFDRCQSWGMFGSFFTTETNQTTYSEASFDGTRFLARPFYDTNPAIDAPANSPLREQLERVSDLAGQGGAVTIDRSQVLRAADLNFRFNLWNNHPTCSKWNWHVDGYAGVKYMGLNESLSIREDLRAYGDILGFPETGGVYTLYFPAGTEITVQDRFSTKNNFIGGNLGLMSELRLGRVFLELRSGIALGGNQQDVSISGSTQFRLPNLPPSAIQNGGLLAQPTNIGTYSRTAFSYIPELGVKMGLQVTDHFRIFAGYDMMYWSNVVRPGQQIDRNVNSSQLPTVNPTTGAVTPSQLNGPAQPAFNFNSSNLWINGFNAGISWIF
jgi:hypothetical protein